VRVHEGEVHLRHEDMRIITRIADDRCALAVAQDIAIAGPGQELGGIAPLKQERMTNRSVSVQALQIELR
jgi:hypothetical protein